MARPTVALVDSGGTNIASVSYALERIGADARLTNNPADIRAADRVILPGVGAAGAGMARLREAGLVEVLHEVEQPLLGVCLGMQLLFAHSAEDGGTECLGLLPGRVVPIPPAPGLRVPHMGWNTLTNLHADPLTEGLADGERAYFVHSFAVPVTAHTLQTTEHSGTWSAVVRSGNRWGAQFHPERSARAGARLLTNFILEVSP
ncbi:imidazole glycerol phosphate synthase subunit HisH [Ornithinimicrobium ciconiae]|uniref:Imidazole glycerol phosphate synthase subunit HisH n=1 Tax=Ornithinimicrobium ciconiae TaxID=2594265 RepID=A0A516GAY1_9MICO|nr:imidazole glycerol phosphate synthase subunit HisH [Ornithinimicrobium ciconiae]QDO88665.1 imidazole glycerol phosphate synthase subunit HisH [Ornithinimicrobium ciconiae]